jgi:hypothetical protein
MAANCEELLVIYQRIGARVDRGTADFAVTTGIIQRRCDAENKIVALLEDAIPKEFDKNDVIASSLVEELRNEVTARRSFATELRSTVLREITGQLTTLREKQKGLQKIVARDISVVQKAINETKSASNSIDTESSKLSQTPPNRLAQQQQRIEKAKEDHRKKMIAEAEVARKIASDGITHVHTQFSDFDSSRLRNLQAAALNFEQLKSNLVAAVQRGIDGFRSRMSMYDGEDRSMRYVGRVFDAKQSKLSEEDPDMYVYALADFKSEDPGDLAFERGDKIKVRMQHKSGWWEGELGTNSGLFPNTFTMIEGKADPKMEVIGAVFLVIADYEPRRGGELKLLVGDFVHVERCQGERCTGTNQRTGQRGYFPLENLEQKI